MQMKNVTVFKQAGRFGGWPANYGIWSWGDEIVVGFVDGYFLLQAQGHAWDKTKKKHEWQARSLDGGETWTVEKTTDLTSPMDGGKKPVECPGGVDFSHPDFAMTCRRSGDGGEAESWFFYSLDRCKTWHGPFIIPNFGQIGIAARTDYQVLDKDSLIVFLTAIKPNGREGRPFCALLTDEGKTWDLISWLGPQPKGYAIMPSSVRLPNGDFLVSIRRAEGLKGDRKFWIDNYVSKNCCATWEYLNTPVRELGGNPPSLNVLHDGRLCLTYGYRLPPYGIRAKISCDNGLTWGQEIILRNDGGNWDLGYPRTVQRLDGKMVTIYYFNDHPDKERYIAATIWDVNS